MNEPKFPKEKILTFKRFAGRRDLLSVLLEDGKEYTLAQAEEAITKAGDTVWNIAKQLTGSGDSWLAIAKRSGLNTNTPEAGTLLDLRE